MGTFRTTIEIGDPQGERYEALEALVDTGSSYTWVPRDILRQLGVEPVGRREFETANGRVIERDVAQTWVRYDGSAHITFIVFGDVGSAPLLGAYTLGGFGLAPDPLSRRLVPVRRLALKAIRRVPCSLPALSLVEGFLVPSRRSDAPCLKPSE